MGVHTDSCRHRCMRLNEAEREIKNLRNSKMESIQTTQKPWYIWQPAVLELAPASDTQTFGVLPFQNEVFDELLSDVRVDVDSESQEHDNNVHLEFSKGFNESQHWHNHRRPILPKHLGGEKAPPKDQWFRSRELRRDQRFMAQLERQAPTITGTFGKGLQRIVITVSSQSLDKRDSEVALSTAIVTTSY